MKRRDVLESVQDCEDTYGALITNSRCTRRDVMRCVRAGLVKSIGYCRVMDGDFAKEPEQEREGFKLTEAGRHWLAVGPPR